MTRRYAVFDEINIGASLVPTNADQILNVSATVDAHRYARSNVGLSAFTGFVEFLIYSQNAIGNAIYTPLSLAPTGGVPPLTIGIVIQTAALNKYCGEDINGYGYCPGDGNVYNNGAVIASLGTSTYGAYIAIYMDPVGGILQFFKNGVPLGSQITIAANSWYFAATTSGAAGDRTLYVNAGQSAFAYPLGTLTGWWKALPAIQPIDIATLPYTTKPTDSLANRRFPGGVDIDSQSTSARSVTFWPFGASSGNAGLSSGSQIQISVLDKEFAYDSLITGDPRDLPVVSRRLQDQGSYDSAEILFSAFVDRVDTNGDYAKTIYCSDIQAQLQRPVNRAVFPPNVDPSVVGKPVPISLGACRNFTPTMYFSNATSTLQNYALHDAPITGIGLVRIAGRPLSLGAGYTLTPDLNGIQLLLAPQGKLTAETTTNGVAYSNTAPDYLQGIGMFDAQVTLNAAWTAGGNTPPNLVASSYLRFVNVSPQVQWVTQNTFPIHAGRTYAYRFRATLVPAYGPQLPPDYIQSPTAYMVFGYQAVHAVEAYAFAVIPLTSPTTVAAGPIDYTGTFTNTITGDARLVVAMISTSSAAGANNEFRLSELVLNENAAVSDNVTLNGLTLTQYVSEVMTRGGFTSQQWSSADTTAIDTATGYLIGNHIEGATTVAGALKPALDTFGAGMYTGRDGTLRFLRIVDPSTQSAIGTLTETDVHSVDQAPSGNELQLFPDYAENLTTRMAGAKNYSPYTDGDFGTTPMSECPLTMRQLLKQPFQWNAVSGQQLSPGYYGQLNAPLESLLDLIANGNTEIGRVCNLYTTKRNFYVATFFQPLGRLFDIGQVWTLQYPRYGLDAGKKLLLLGVTDYLSENAQTCQLTFWG